MGVISGDYFFDGKSIYQEAPEEGRKAGRQEGYWAM